MKQYVALCLVGDSTIPNRNDILEKKKKTLLDKLQEINDCIDFINTKQQFYDDVLDVKIKYISNLIDVNSKE